MSAHYTVDLAQHVAGGVSIAPSVGSAPTSGVNIGLPVDLKLADSLTTLLAFGGANSGVLALQIQTAPAFSGNPMSGGYPASGTFTDPTSGMVDFPAQVKSGGMVYFNSGLVSLPNGGAVSGTMGLGTLSYGFNPNFNGQGAGGCGMPISGSYPIAGSGGFFGLAGFQRPSGHRFGRVNIVGLASGFTGFVGAALFGQLKTTGSGGGSTQVPQDGTPSI